MFRNEGAVPHYVPQNVPQWGTWGTYLIVPHFLYSMMLTCKCWNQHGKKIWNGKLKS